MALSRFTLSAGPTADWLPLAAAIFAFNGRARRNMLDMMLVGRAVAGRPRHSGMSFNPARPDLRRKAGADLIYCGVDHARGLFKYGWAVSGDPGDERTDGLYFQPWQFTLENQPPELNSETWATLCNLASMTWNFMFSQFDEGVRSGRFVIAGRPGSALAPTFVHVPADTWPAFEIERWDPTVASTQQGERLFGVHAIPLSAVAEPAADFITAMEGAPNIEAAPAASPEEHRRRGGIDKQGNALRALEALFPAGRPELLQKVIHAQVSDWLAARDLAKISERTLQRVSAKVWP